MDDLQLVDPLSVRKFRTIYILFRRNCMVQVLQQIRVSGVFLTLSNIRFAEIMDAAKEEKSLLETIRPPRLEDAGLEDCALPPEAIKEAFFKAANSIRSLITTDDGNGDSKDCVEDPGPTEGELCDSLIGIDLEPGSPAPCANVKGGGLPEVLGDDVVVGVTGAENGGEEGSDRLLGSEVDFERGKKACVDGLQGLEIDEKDDKFDRDEEEKEKPILVEGYI